MTSTSKGFDIWTKMTDFLCKLNDLNDLLGLWENPWLHRSFWFACEAEQLCW